MRKTNKESNHLTITQSPKAESHLHTIGWATSNRQSKRVIPSSHHTVSVGLYQTSYQREWPSYRHTVSQLYKLHTTVSGGAISIRK